MEQAQSATTCNNIAVLNYESTYKLLPPSGIVNLHRDLNYNVQIFNFLGGVRLSWIVLVLPYLKSALITFSRSKLCFRVELLRLLRWVNYCVRATMPSADFISIATPVGRSNSPGNYAALRQPISCGFAIAVSGRWWRADRGSSRFLAASANGCC